MSKLKVLNPDVLDLDDLNEVENWLTVNKEKSNYHEYIIKLADKAIAESKLTVLQLLTKHGHNLLSMKAADGAYLVHIAAYHGNNEALSYFASLGDIDMKSDLGNTPLYIAMRHGHNDTVDHLVNLGCKVDPEKPIIRKAHPKILDELIGKLDSKILNMAELLKANGFEPNLDFYEIFIPDGKFDIIDLSNMSFISCNIRFNINTTVSFESSNLQDALIASNDYKLITGETICFKGANLKGLSGIIEKNFYESIETQNETNLIPIDQDNYFSQLRLIKNNNIKGRNQEELSEGVCLGLSIEHGRSIIRALQKNADCDLDLNFLNKLKLLYEPSNGKGSARLERIKMYQDDLQHIFNERELSLNSLKEFSESLLDQFPDSEFFMLHLPHHAATMRIIKDPKTNTVKGYKLFDPNFGLAHVQNNDELFQLLSKLMVLYQRLTGDNQTKLFAADLPSYLEGMGLVCSDVDQYNKDSKNLHELFNAIKNQDIEKLAKLSANQKIDYHNHFYRYSPPSKLLITEEAALKEHNPLQLAIRNGADGVLITLISNNTKLDLSKSSCMVLITNLIKADKLSKAVVETLSKKALELGQTEAKELFDSILEIQQQCGPDSFKLDLKTNSININSKPEQQKAKELADDIVKTLEYNEIDIVSYHSTNCTTDGENTVLHTVQLASYEVL
jgi:ankyrin repeat protein